MLALDQLSIKFVRYTNLFMPVVKKRYDETE